MNELIDQFRNAMIAAGLTPPANIIADEKKHRFSTNGKANDTAGEYRIYPDQIPAGYFLDLHTGVYQTWRLDLGRPFTPEETREYQATAERRKQHEESEQNAIAKKAQAIWDAAPAANASHPYVISKKISPIGLRVHKDSLIVPVTNKYLGYNVEPKQSDIEALKAMFLECWQF